MPNDSLYSVDAELFMHVRRAAGSDDSRYYLQGVFIEPIPEGGAWLVATDGFIMLVARDATAHAPAPALVSLSLLEVQDEFCECGDHITAAQRDFTRGRLLFEDPGVDISAVTLRNEWAAYRETIGVVECPAPPEKYPPWRRVWGDPSADGTKQVKIGPETDSYGFDPALLSRLAGARAFRLITETDSGPSVVLFHDKPELVGLIVPKAMKSSPIGLATDLRRAAVALASA
ncbi:hypothetical protein JI664_23505 [Rhodobacter sp. NTK016B]|uniref:hypothetical protein n=1 Tax=Rhodobacter sp. NTK016B TaxID=2759676 RepID=UPI001A8E1BC5|nr:hypothetical protein [Rhodobacter sp. NTK016B]MBN8294958.1 hypothetical protein [Rhodobacter sp. NTK016B]